MQIGLIAYLGTSPSALTSYANAIVAVNLQLIYSKGFIGVLTRSWATTMKPVAAFKQKIKLENNAKKARYLREQKG